MRRIEIVLSLAALFLAFAAMPAIATPSVTTIHPFSGADGLQPSASLIQGADGLLYGTASGGGANTDGNIFKIDTAGNNFDDLLDFDGASTPFGLSPLGNVIQGTDGNLYGTTSAGGANGEGTVFKVASDGGGYTDLYDFGGVANDAVLPFAGLVEGSDGNFYGTTKGGGANGDGTIYKISSTGGSISILHSFGPNDLLEPEAALIEAEDGSLYGTTVLGGAGTDGGIFRINLDGTGYAVLHAFAGSPNDGNASFSSLTQGGDGLLYGVTKLGGTNSDGAVFKIAPDGTGYQVLYSFAGGSTDATAPLGTLALGNDGNLYGSLFAAGPSGDGALFEIARSGSTDTILHDFSGTDGADPQAGLVQATNGDFYGSTHAAGANGDGTLFMLDNGLSASPTGLYALGSDAQVQLFWTNDINAITYNLYRSTTSGGEGNTPFKTGLASPHYVDNNVTQSTPYFYQVTSVNAGVESAKSYEVTGEPMMSIASTNGLTATPNPITASKSTTGTVTLTQATTGPTTAFLSSSDPSVTFTSPDVTVPAGQISTIFTINTANTGQAVAATITASENGTDASTTLNVNAPAVLHTFQPGLQMISANTYDAGTTLSNDFAQSSPELAVWTGSSYAITPTAPANDIVPGQGYWFHPTSAVSLYDIGADQSNGFAVNVSLAQGWNMIGDPYSNSISGTDLQIQSGANTLSLVAANTAGIVGAAVYTWQPGDVAYETQPISAVSLQPYEGYWLFAFKPCTLALQDTL